MPPGVITALECSSTHKMLLNPSTAVALSLSQPPCGPFLAVRQSILLLHNLSPVQFLLKEEPHWAYAVLLVGLCCPAGGAIHSSTAGVTSTSCL